MQWLLEHGGEGDAFEAIERLGVALDLHAQDGALPGREQELGQVLCSESRSDLAGPLPFRDAGGERRAPSAKISASRVRNISLCGAASRLKSPMRQPRANPALAIRSVMMSR